MDIAFEQRIAHLHPAASAEMNTYRKRRFSINIDQKPNTSKLIKSTFDTFYWLLKSTTCQISSTLYMGLLSSCVVEDFRYFSAFYLWGCALPKIAIYVVKNF
jgi:hypothetical protein